VAFRRRLQGVPADDDRAGPLARIESQHEVRDEGLRSGDWTNLAIVSGAVLYDFGGRLNEIYPDKRLAQAALQAMRPGIFPPGAQGAGRMAMQGGFFGCDAHSREGGAEPATRNTTISLIVTNQKLNYAALQVIDRMRGPTGTSAALTLKRKGDDQLVHITVMREPIRLRPLLKVEMQNDALVVEAVGGERVFEFGTSKPTIVTPLSDTEFYVPGRYHTRIEFTKDATGKVVGAILNPGRWEQRGVRSN
jgi:hypothetical protein